MVSSNMTPALYKSLLILKEIRVMLLQRTAFGSGPKDLQLAVPPKKGKCRFFAPKDGAQNDRGAHDTALIFHGQLSVMSS
jgi:hypothetical protein